ncbi:MAG: GNAT family N-acetyltransferase [Spirochaetia bacterium]|nr:GNAT family N-acetyltransferase [Spirochaetia bacterium]
MDKSRLIGLLERVERSAFEIPWTYEMLDGSLDETARIGLTDVQGRLLEIKNLNDSTLSVDSEVDISGFYLARLGLEYTELLRIAIRPEFRRRGIARTLMSDLAGYGRVLLEVSTNNPAARALYESAGYTTIARRKSYYSDGSDCIVMEKP